MTPHRRTATALLLLGLGSTLSLGVAGCAVTSDGTEEGFEFSGEESTDAYDEEWEEEEVNSAELAKEIGTLGDHVPGAESGTFMQKLPSGDHVLCVWAKREGDASNLSLSCDWQGLSDQGGYSSY